MGVTIDRLGNGLTVYISREPSQPRVEAWVVIRAGGRNDPASSTGLAHYLEHMMFKATNKLGTLDYSAEQPHIDAVAELYKQLATANTTKARRPTLAQIDRHTQAMAAYAIPNEFDQLYAGLGILDLNAYTSQEETAYSADVPSSRLATWAEVEGNRFQHPVFRLFLPELEAVYEEKNMALDDPDERVYDHMLAALFPEHPYGTQPIIGHAKHLKTPAYGDMEDFFRTHYIPNNAAIMLAGDVSRTEVIPILERAFAGWQPQPHPPAPVLPLTGPRGKVEATVIAEGEQSVTLAWRTVPVGHPDELALVALDRLVDHRSRGLLHDALLLSQKLPDASSMSELLREGGYWSLSGVAREGQPLDHVEALLRGVVDDLKAGKFSDEDLAAVTLHAQIDHQLALESRASRVAHMTSAYATGQQWRDYVHRLDLLAVVTRDDVQAVARRYLGGDHVVVFRRDGIHKPPVLPKPHITPVAIDPARESAYARSIRARAHQPPTPRWLTIGTQVHAGRNLAGPIYATRNTHSDLFQLVYQFDTGLRVQPLLCHALDLLELSGAGSGTAVSLQKQLHSLGTSIKTECGAQEMRITVTGIDAHLERSVKLLRAWLRAPVFNQKTLEDLLANTLSQRRDEQASPEAVAHALAAFAQYGDVNYYRLQPSDALLQQTQGDTLLRILGEIPHLPHTTLYYGTHERSSLTQLTDLGSTYRQPARSFTRHYRRIDGPTLFFVDKPMAQAMIEVLLPAGPLSTEDEPLAIALQHLMGNDSSGVVFQELRESRGLAYSAYASFELPRRPDDEASLYAHVGTQAEKAVSALGLLLGLLRTPPIDTSRFTSTQHSLIEEYLTSAIVPRDMPYWIHRWRKRGHMGDPRPQELAAISGLEIAQLQVFGEKIARAHPIISLFGDRKRIDFDALRTAIPGVKIIELQAADLFGYAGSK